MIIGVGVDILDIRRIDNLLRKFPEKFEQKYFTKAERDFCHVRSDYVSTFAKMFSIKESIIKSIKDKKGLMWHGIEIFHDEFGAPNVVINCGKYLSEKYKFHISTSDEFPYVISYAILEQN